VVGRTGSAEILVHAGSSPVLVDISIPLGLSGKKRVLHLLLVGVLGAKGGLGELVVPALRLDRPVGLLPLAAGEVRVQQLLAKGAEMWGTRQGVFVQ